MNNRDLPRGVYELFANYDAGQHPRKMDKLKDHYLSKHQFAERIGKCRLYQCLPLG